MKLTKGKKTALVCFAVFLGFMAVCTVVAKGIYASGLPRVTAGKPYSGSLSHVIKADGTVMQGQEYGIYVEAGLRVDTLSVDNGDTFQAGDPMFRIDVGDLADILAERRLEIAKLEVQMAEAVRESSRDRLAREQAAQRAREDYDREAVLADAQIQERRQAYDAAQRALVLYNQYLENSSKPADNGAASSQPADGGTDEDGGGTEESQEEEESGNTGGSDVTGEGETEEHPGGDEENCEVEPGMDEAEPVTSEADSEAVDGEIIAGANMDSSGTTGQKAGGESRRSKDGGGIGEGKSGGEDTGERWRSELHKVGSVVGDPEDQYNKEEKRRQMEQNVIAAAQALENAERQKEDRLQNAARAVEDAEAAIEAANSTVNTLALDITYRKESLHKLEELLAADGWVYAENSGRVIENRLEVGERIQDRASILYALDNGERIISVILDEEQARYVSEGTEFEMKASMPDGRRVTAKALVDYLEKREDGMVYARFSFEQPEISIGQSVELVYRMQTENYSTCVPVSCIYQDGGNNYYVYVAEEQPGILGTEWRARKVTVTIQDQNDTMAAIWSGEITGDTRIVLGSDKILTDGAVVRVL